MSELKLPPFPQAMGVITLPGDFNHSLINEIIKQALFTTDHMLQNGAAAIELTINNYPEVKVTLQQEIDLYTPIVEAITASTALPVCVTTSRPEVMEAVVK